MEAARTPAITPLAEQSNQLERPSADIIWARAIEVFGEEKLAARWMRTPLPALEHSTLEQYALSGDPAKLREVLTILGRIDHGLFS
ncbi:MAG TPA: MbcA/ParS/Xre antitoxin family protein [Bryobacteraceae bacterium]